MLDHDWLPAVVVLTGNSGTAGANASSCRPSRASQVWAGGGGVPLPERRRRAADAMRRTYKDIPHSWTAESEAVVQNGGNSAADRCVPRNVLKTEAADFISQGASGKPVPGRTAPPS